MKILVVDDERVLVKGIKFNLESEGYQVEVGYDGEQAVRRQGGDQGRFLRQNTLGLHPHRLRRAASPQKPPRRKGQKDRAQENGNPFQTGNLHKL